MTSKSLLVKLIRDDFKKRNWLIILSVLVLCLVIPGFVLNEVQSEADLVTNGSVSLEAGRQVYRYLISFSSQRFYLYAAGGFGFLAAISGFSYLHSRSKLDFYHSLPVKREIWYLVQYLSGLAMFGIPLLAGMGVNLSIGAIYHFLDLSGVLTALWAVLVYLFLYLLAFSVSTLAAMLTGRLLVSVLLAPVLAFYGVGAVFLCKAFQQTFFSTYFELGSSEINLAVCFSPGYLAIQYVEGMQQMLRGGDAPDFLWVYFLAIVAETLLFIFLGLGLCRRRKTEAAGNPVVFPRVTAVLKLFVVTLAALGAGLYIKKFSYTQSDLWFFGGLALGVVVAYALLEFVFQGDLRAVWKPRGQFAAVAVLSFGIACLFRFDWFGYDSYFPAIEQVDSMSVQSSRMSEVYNQTYLYSDNTSIATSSQEQMILDSYQMNEFEPIYAMAENGVGNVHGSLEENLEKTQVSVKFNLKNGNQVYRSYYVDNGLFEEKTEELFEMDGFVEVLYPIFGEEEGESLVSLEGSGLLGEAGYHELLSDAEKEEFLSCYREELSTLRYSEIHSSDLLGSLTLTYEGEDGKGGYYGHSDVGYPILKRFTKTIAVLEKLGIVFPEQIDAEDVTDIVIMDGYGENEIHLMAQEAGEPDLVTEQEKQELLDILEYQDNVSLVMGDTSSHVYLTLYGKENGYLQDFCIEYTRIPAEIRTFLEERGFSI